MPFPTTEMLELTAQAAFGADLTADPNTWSWTDLLCEHPSIPAQTISRLTNNPITHTQGVLVGAARSQTTTAAVELLNVDGAWTPELASSPHYPYVDVGTPFRVMQRHDTSVFADTFTRSIASGGWGTSTSGLPWNTPSTPAQWSVSGSQGQITIPAANNLYGITNGLTVANCDVVFDMTAPAVATGGPFLGGPRLRVSTDLSYYWPFLELGTSGTVRVGAYRYLQGAGTSIAGATVAGLTYTAGNPVRCRVRHDGDRIRIRVWLPVNTEPSTWTVDVVNSEVTLPGQFGWIWWRTAGNTNAGSVVLSLDNLTVTHLPYAQIEGYIADVTPSFLPVGDGGFFSTVKVQVAGIGSLSEKQDSPKYSPMRRSIQQAAEVPIAYWPLEDDAGSTVGVSAFPGGTPMTVTGPAVFGFDAGTPTDQWLSRFGTKPNVSVAAGARLSGVVPLSGVNTEWAFTLTANFYVGGISPPITALRVAQWETPSGTWNRWALVSPATGGYIVRAYNDADGTTSDVVATSAFFYVGVITYTVEAEQSGGNINVTLFANDNALVSGSVAGTLSAITRVTVNPDRTNTTASTSALGIKFVVGHVRVLDETFTHDTPYYVPPETGTVVTALKAWYLEPAHRRVERLCQEERVPFTLIGSPGLAGSTILGAQRDGGFTDLITQAADSESGGLLYESRFGYAHMPRSQRYNQTAALVIDMAQYKRSDGTSPEEVLAPELDTRRPNQWTVTRNGGASGLWAADAAYRKRRGTIAEEAILDVLTDEVVTDHAAWRTHVNVDGKSVNYPGMQVDLAANPELIDGWMRCRIGSRVQRINQPTIAGVGTIDQVIEGITETISPTSWTAELAVAPAVVWDVGTYDGTTRYAPASTTLTGALNSSAMSFTMGGETWQTGAYSLLLEIDGEHILINNVTGSGPYTVTVAQRSVNGRVASHLSGASVSLAQPARWAL